MKHKHKKMQDIISNTNHILGDIYNIIARNKVIIRMIKDIYGPLGNSAGQHQRLKDK